LKNKILLIGNSLSTMLRFRQKLFDNLSKDYDLTLFTPVGNNDTSNYDFEIKENYLKNARKVPLLNIIMFFWALRKLCKKNYEYTFIYGVGVCFISGIYLRLFGKTNYRVIFFFTGLGAIFLRKRYHFLRYILTKHIIIKVPYKIIVLNEDDKKYLCACSKNTDLSNKIIVVAGEGVPADLKLPLQPPSDEIKRLVFVSRPFLDKGCSEFSDIITMLRDKNVNLPITVYGFDKNDKGELNDIYFDKLQALRVQFEGRVDHLEKYLRPSDCMMIISDREGANRVLLECLHLRLLFIASDVPGIENFVPDSLKEILLTDFKDPSIAVEKIINILAQSPKKNLFCKDTMTREVKYASTIDVIRFYKTHLLGKSPTNF